jgi:hypothetical protein
MFLNNCFLKFIYCVVLTGVCFCGYAQENNTVKVAGRTVSKNTFLNASGVKVQNIRTYQTVISDANGRFYLKVKLGDTLLFNASSYFPNTITLTEISTDTLNPVIFYLSPRYIKLETVEIIANKTPSHTYANSDNVKPATIMSPVSFIYEKLSRGYKAYEKLEEQKNKDSAKEYLRWRLSGQQIFSIIHLKNKELDTFTDFCAFDENFIRRSSDYDFIVAVKAKYKDYLLTKIGENAIINFDSIPIGVK